MIVAAAKRKEKAAEEKTFPNEPAKGVKKRYGLKRVIPGAAKAYAKVTRAKTSFQMSFRSERPNRKLQLIHRKIGPPALFKNRSKDAQS